LCESVGFEFTMRRSIKCNRFGNGKTSPAGNVLKIIYLLQVYDNVRFIFMNLPIVMNSKCAMLIDAGIGGTIFEEPGRD
jgi:hypothetical protein